MSPTLALALSALTLAATPGAAELPPTELWVHEDWPIEALAQLARQPQVVLAVATRSNMMRSDLLALLRRQPGALVQVRLPVAETHLEQLRRLANATLVVDLPEQPSAALAARLTHLGPQPIRFRLARLDEARARWLKAFKNCEVELDLRGRVPDQEEIALLRGLSRARRAVWIGAGAPPALVAALRAVSLSRLVVDSEAAPPLVAALAEFGAPVRAVASEAAADLPGLGALAGLGFEVPLAETPALALARLERLRSQYAPAR